MAVFDLLARNADETARRVLLLRLGFLGGFDLDARAEELKPLAKVLDVLVGAFTAFKALYLVNSVLVPIYL